MAEGMRLPGYDSREVRGSFHTWKRTDAEYEFPVTTYRVGPSGERIPMEAINS
jgi:hypothetical protein